MTDHTGCPIVGFPKEWNSFFERHPIWPTALGNLHQVLEQLFIRNVELESPAEKLVFFMGRLCVEDFNEAFLLAANGYGLGSLKILRGLYERIVTTAYIAGNQDEAIHFLEYHYIHRGRLMRHAETFFGNLEELIDKAEIAEAKNDDLKYRDRFTQTKCEKCGTKTIMHSWSKLDLASMAKKTGLENLYFPGYYYPTLQAHATAAAVMYRLKSSELNPIAFNEESQPDAADRSLIIAHNLIIRLVGIQSDFFRLDLDREMGLLSADYRAVWGKETDDGGHQKEGV
ncbi:MAG: DUF5677 domain-containing protein [Syntrophaceae bacterium]